MEIVKASQVQIEFSSTVPNGGREGRDVFHTSFDHEVEPVDAVIVESVAAIQNKEMDDLDPLFDAIDPEALRELLASGGDDEMITEVSFEYEGMEVMVEPSEDQWNLWIQWL